MLLVRFHVGSEGVDSLDWFEGAVKALCIADAAARPAAPCNGFGGGARLLSAALSPARAPKTSGRDVKYLRCKRNDRVSVGISCDVTARRTHPEERRTRPSLTCRDLQIPCFFRQRWLGIRKS